MSFAPVAFVRGFTVASERLSHTYSAERRRGGSHEPPPDSARRKGSLLARGGYIDGEKFRHREWAPAPRGAGIAHRRIYDMRHTFATWAIEGGVHASYLAVVIGTSIRELENTYLRWLRRTDDQLRKVLDEYDLRPAAQTG
jgi:integrase